VKLWINCKSATELASLAMDLALPLSARVALKLHHLVCVNCARYARQLDLIRRLVRHESAAALEHEPALSDSAKARIENELLRKLDA